MPTRLFNMQTFANLDLEDGSDLPPWATINGNPEIRICLLAGDGESAGTMAAWTAERDGFTYTNLPSGESAFLLQGRARLTEDSGTVTEVSAGQGYSLPAGWSGTFEALEPVRKVFYLLSE
ncbi:cupin domain-containing protein [Arthrobacter sp. GCM10027362]|uniref:cupin domain-containing protein n=1 Tax=Arthrobacter sp. GCM10027362 TaxID=3273379 RepID=UPI00363F0172